MPDRSSVDGESDEEDAEEGIRGKEGEMKRRRPEGYE
jgi:hypothetical protein